MIKEQDNTSSETEEFAKQLLKQIKECEFQFRAMSVKYYYTIEIRIPKFLAKYLPVKTVYGKCTVSEIDDD